MRLIMSRKKMKEMLEVARREYMVLSAAVGFFTSEAEWSALMDEKLEIVEHFETLLNY